MLQRDPVHPTASDAIIASYDQLLDYMSIADRPYHMYLPPNGAKPTKEVLSWLEDIFGTCGTKVDGSLLRYKIKIGNRVNTTPFTYTKYAQHVPLPHKIKPASPPSPERPPSPLVSRFSLPDNNAVAGPSSDHIIASSLAPSQNAFVGLKRKFPLAKPLVGRYPATNKLAKTATTSDEFGFSSAGRYDDAEIDERFGDADSVRREEDYEYQTDHSSEDDEDRNSVISMMGAGESYAVKAMVR